MPRDNGLLAQHQFVLAVMTSGRFTALDHGVAGTIMKRYYPKYGNARVSLRYLEQATGATRTNVIASRRRLVDGGAFYIVSEGIGTRPTEIAPNFDFSSSGIAGDTTSNDDHSGIAGDTSGGIAGDTTTVASGTAGKTESYLHMPVYETGILIDRLEPASPSAPAAAGAEAPRTPGSAGEEESETKGGFEELWVAYGYRRGRAEARKAYEAVAPDSELHASMVAAAVEWRETWAAQGKADAPRFSLAKWIEREEYECAPPTAYQPKARRPKPASQPSARPRAADRAVVIVASDVVRDGADSRLVAQLEADGSPVGELVIDLETDNAETQAAGQRRFAELTRAMDLLTVDDSKDLHGRPFILKADGSFAPVQMQEAA